MFFCNCNWVQDKRSNNRKRELEQENRRTKEKEGRGEEGNFLFVFFLFFLKILEKTPRKKQKHRHKYRKKEQKDNIYFIGINGRRILAASNLKAISEFFDKILSFAKPTTLLHTIICNSMGSLLIMLKKRMAEEEAERVE